MWIMMFGTTKGFLLSKKTIAYRSWSQDWAAQFHVGDIVDCYNKSPRLNENLGSDTLKRPSKIIGHIRLTKDPYKMVMRDMPDNHFERMAIKDGGYTKTKEEFIEYMGGMDAEPYVIEFEKVNKAGVAI